MSFKPISDLPCFPIEEQSILKYWIEINAFQECLKQSKNKPFYTFYDGPPFATGLPHYGHILASTIKDVICRYAHQCGYHVERRFGWDCHGVPIETIIDAKFNIKNKNDIIKMGIDNYNKECQSIVQQYVNEWKQIITRFGRWVDFDNDYKTMDLNYMESVWWCFKTIYDKGMIYKAFKVMAYSTALATPLSNFEASLNYKDITDPSIIVQFKRKDRYNSFILVWTTTPWTLPSNMALCINPILTYILIKNKHNDIEWLVGKDQIEWICNCLNLNLDNDFELLDEIIGEYLVGISYEPIFSYFINEYIDNEKIWTIISDEYITSNIGTCIVHQAPGFGEDDFRVCLKFNIIDINGSNIICPVDDNGYFTQSVTDLVGLYVKNADNIIIKKLKNNNMLIFSDKLVHSYPHCWRSDIPLIYKIVSAWFVKIDPIRDNLINNNNLTNWIPSFIKEKRFHNWLLDANDWCISRNRFWGTPIPIWVSDDLQEIICIGSIAELQQYTSVNITDLHRHFIDNITILSPNNRILKRIDEVFDCWFESGSMPYCCLHYPFENIDKFEQSFPAQFIAEGLDQTRGWFYTLMVLSTHLFNKPAFYNLICNGLILAADGKKMSKRLHNYPDPIHLANIYGADAVRLYMCNSPVVRAEPLKFNEFGVRDIVKNIFFPWYHAYRFFIQSVISFESSNNTRFIANLTKQISSNFIMDHWIISSLHQLIKFVHDEMNSYKLYTVVNSLIKFLDNLTNWYMRLNRDRFRSFDSSSFIALNTLYIVLFNITVLFAPFIPFITEFFYLNLINVLPNDHLMKKKSVHWVMMPKYDPETFDDHINLTITHMQTIIEFGRICRQHRSVNLKTPLKSIIIHTSNLSFIDNIKIMEPYILNELNVLHIQYSSDMSNFILSPSLNFKLLGKKLGNDMKIVQNYVKSLSQNQLLEFESTGIIDICGHKITSDEMFITRSFRSFDNPDFYSYGNSDVMIIMDFTSDNTLIYKRIARNIVSNIQKLRKSSSLNPLNSINIWAFCNNDSCILANTLHLEYIYINKLLRSPLFIINDISKLPFDSFICKASFDIDNDSLLIYITYK